VEVRSLPCESSPNSAGFPGRRDQWGCCGDQLHRQCTLPVAAGTEPSGPPARQQRSESDGRKGILPPNPLGTSVARADSTIRFSAGGRHRVDVQVPSFAGGSVAETLADRMERVADFPSQSTPSKGDAGVGARVGRGEPSGTGPRHGISASKRLRACAASSLNKESGISTRGCARGLCSAAEGSGPFPARATDLHNGAGAEPSDDLMKRTT